jgi:hypothetical protein
MDRTCLTPKDGNDHSTKTKRRIKRLARNRTVTRHSPSIPRQLLPKLVEVCTDRSNTLQRHTKKKLPKTFLTCRCFKR